MSTRVLVTGGSGFIGTHLCRLLTDQKYLVTVIDLKKPSPAISGVEYHQGDVRSVSIVRPLIEEADVIIHLAATVSVPVCENDPIESNSNNFTATLILLDLVKQTMQKQNRTIRLAFASSAALYGTAGDDGHAVKESEASEPYLSHYASQKAASEQALQKYTKTEKVPTLAFRFFNVFGPGQDPTSPYSGVIALFSGLAKKNKDLPLNAGGIQTRDFISVYDIVSAIASSLTLSADKWDASAINLGTGNTTTIRELADLICEVSKSKSKIVNARARSGDVMHSRADISLAKKLLGFQPQHTLNTSIQELL